MNANKFKDQQVDFAEREFFGTLIEVRDIKRGTHLLKIRQHKTNDVFEYHLPISTFIETHHINVNDSIAKSANSPMVIFFKKVNSRYEKCCELLFK